MLRLVLVLMMEYHSLYTKKVLHFFYVKKQGLLFVILQYNNSFYVFVILNV